MAEFLWPMKGYSKSDCDKYIGCKFGCGYSVNKNCSAHGGRKKPGHGGIDINGIPGRSIKDAEIIAVADGKVHTLNAGCSHHGTDTCECGGGWGNYVKIQHDNKCYTVSAHLASVKVTKGATVKAGQIIGTVGRTGRIKTSKPDGGYHLHFEIHNDKDVRVNPLDFKFVQSTGQTPDPASYPRPTEVLKSGTKNDQVKWLQDKLNFLMKANLEIDGSYGPKTTAAVKEFQKKYGLAVDGIFGPKSREKMFQLVPATGSK